MRKCFLLLFAISFLCGCASVYKPIRPASLNYINEEIGEQISYAYKFDVLNERGNKKYAKKEDKYDIDVVSVRLINNSENELDFNKNVKFYIGDKEIYPLESNTVTTRIKQGTFGYLLYGLIFLYINDGSTTTRLPIGLPIGVGNMIVAGVGNENFKKEFTNFNLVNRKIKPNETVYGLVAFSNIDYGKIEIKIEE